MMGKNRAKKRARQREGSSVTGSSPSSRKDSPGFKRARPLDQEEKLETSGREELAAKEWLTKDEGQYAKKQLQARFDLIELLENSDGLIRIDNFLPDHVADYALQVLKTLPEDRWSVREKDGKERNKNTVSHHFKVANPHHEDKNDPLKLITGLIESLLPEKRSVISAAKYEQGGHIEDHDDHAYVYHKFPWETKTVFCSRDIAAILYLTKDWKHSDGGLLVDKVTGKEYVPKFNSLVSFVVPRFHSVTAVKPRPPGKDPRFSIFGWFLVEGDLYKYEPEEHLQEEEASSSNHNNSKKHKKNRRRKKK